MSDNEKKEINCDLVVFCAGSSITRLLKTHFNSTIPVIPIKGYSFNYEVKSSFDPKINFFFMDKAVVGTRMKDNIMRIAAFGDVAGHDMRFDEKRVNHLKNVVSYYLDPEELSTITSLKFCFRPTTPDDLPVIGAMKFYPNVILNSGHAGRGTTIGIVTGKITEELINKGESKIYDDISVFSPRRFNL